ncbi:MAG: hypothetical protein NTY35_12090 [Planctomycetota bacterium]|nr:hypothetical protein [Planctomycetota bacterium]
MSRPGRVAWIALLALPALALGARLLLASRDEDRLARPERGRASAVPGPAIWTGQAEIDGLGRVGAQLAPLHADAARQAFEAGILRGRIAGLAGDPYLLLLEIQRGPTASARLDPTSLRVEDDVGLALSVPSIAARDESDPIATLLRPPTSLAAGERASLVVFGREPGPGARLVGADGLTLPLTSVPRASGASDLPIASIDRRAPAAPEHGQ